MTTMRERLWATKKEICGQIFPRHICSCSLVQTLGGKDHMKAINLMNKCKIYIIYIYIFLKYFKYIFHKLICVFNITLNLNTNIEYLFNTLHSTSN